MNKDFCERLKELRIEKKLSMMELGEQIGVSNTTVCRWENGISDITGDNLKSLAQFFGVTTDYLLGLED